MVTELVPLCTSPLMERVTRECVGRARGYQKGSTIGFWSYHNTGQTIDGYYANGLLITYGGSPRQHIWTYVAGTSDTLVNSNNCPCAVGGGSAPPPFVGTNYYCESGAVNGANWADYYMNDPLWDGSGCVTSNCCNNTTQPWFYNDLGVRTTSDVETRLCAENRFAYSSILIDYLELYIQ